MMLQLKGGTSIDQVEGQSRSRTILYAMLLSVIAFCFERIPSSCPNVYALEDEAGSLQSKPKRIFFFFFCKTVSRLRKISFMFRSFLILASYRRRQSLNSVSVFHVTMYYSKHTVVRSVIATGTSKGHFLKTTVCSRSDRSSMQLYSLWHVSLPTLSFQLFSSVRQ